AAPGQAPRPPPRGRRLPPQPAFHPRGPPCPRIPEIPGIRTGDGRKLDGRLDARPGPGLHRMGEVEGLPRPRPRRLRPPRPERARRRLRALPRPPDVPDP